jgi:chromate transporter
VSVAVNPGWLSMDQFMVGFAVIQMMPGPLSNLAAYIGAIYMGVPGAVVGVIGFFLPGILLIIAVLPFWDRVRKVPNVRPFLAGVNAMGLGLILAVGIALYLKVVQDPADAVVSVVTACLVGFMGYSSLVSVLLGALVGFLFSPTCLSWGQQAYLMPAPKK